MKQTQPSTDIRIALVLYGGISLAIYENGVARTFYDLVKRRGLFGPLLDLLDARVVVDVLSGASAGGVNAPMLAAALESGADFHQMAELWRDLGDVGALLRPVSEANQAESLFSGDYYQTELMKAFRKLLVREPKDDFEEYGEIDLFVTGTDLRGHVTTYYDGLGTPIEDKSHRIVFQLKHRPQRKILGLNRELTDECKKNHCCKKYLLDRRSEFSTKTLKDLQSHHKASYEHLKEILDQQAWNLASIARITSAFPAAFPPFRLDQIEKKFRGFVQEAIENLGFSVLPKRYDAKKSEFLDGGILDNKPFGPALRAIFHRMPEGKVERKLFYVEPDPEEFNQNHPKKKTKPVQVAVASLSSLPSHQSIGEKLEDLREHNERVRWLNGIKNDWRPNIDQILIPPAVTASYLKIRWDAISKSLTLDGDEIAWAGRSVSPNREPLYHALNNYFAVKDLDPDQFDIDFHLRRAFHYLYKLHDELRSEDNDDKKIRITILGRTIKLLKMIRDGLVRLREKIQEPTGGDNMENDELDAEAVANTFRIFLKSVPIWGRIAAELSEASIGTELGNREINSNPLGRESLGQINAFIREWIDRIDDLQHIVNKAGELEDTILQIIGRMISRIVKKDSESFRRLDTLIFPLEYACGLYELDEIDFIRVSPKDAQKGLSEYPAKEKVAGDEFFHFSSFFRKDWRSNDILWGRLDTICRVIDTLLCFEPRPGQEGQELEVTERKRNEFLSRARRSTFEALFPEELIKDLSKDRISELQSAFHALQNPQDRIADTRRFAGILMIAAQELAVQEDLPGVYNDYFYQQISWDQTAKQNDKPCDLEGIESNWGLTAIQMKATQFAGALLQDMKATAKNAYDEFKKMGLGSQGIIGPKSTVPLNVFAEYVTRSYLMLWGMLGHSFGEKIMNRQQIKIVFRTPVYAINRTLHLMRRDKYLTAMLFTAILTSAIILVIVGKTKNDNDFFVYAFLLLAFLTILNWLESTPLGWISAILFWMLAISAAGFLIYLLGKNLGIWEILANMFAGLGIQRSADYGWAFGGVFAASVGLAFIHEGCSQIQCIENSYLE